MSREAIIENAKKYLGKPYVWGGESMEEGGYDCSGYAYNVLRDSGFNVNRSTADGYRSIGKKIGMENINVGDLVFYGNGEKATHIAIYAGNGMIYESVGGSSNTKSNPGKGVVCSEICRRSDLMEVRTLFEDGQATENANTAQEVKRTWLQQGDNGQKVTDMQIMLIAVGYSCGECGADGYFGSDTASALERFQSDYGLKVDKLYGENSKSKLESVYIAKKATLDLGYTVGQVYSLQAEMKVREGAGTNYRAKAHGELTADGKTHDADGDGALEKGTRVTCKAVKKVGSDTWIETPSGWIAAIYCGKVYIK